MKNRIITLCLGLFIISVSLKAQVKVVAPITTNNPSDTYSTHSDSLGKGGFMSLQSVAVRDLIPVDRRKYGMLVYIVDDNKFFQLKKSGVLPISDNTQWQEVSLSSFQQGPTAMLWQGSLSAAPSNPQANWSYYDRVLNISRIYNATLSRWDTLAYGQHSKPIVIEGTYVQPYTQIIPADSFLMVMVPVYILGKNHEQKVGNTNFYKDVFFHVGPNLSVMDRTFIPGSTPGSASTLDVNTQGVPPTTTINNIIEYNLVGGVWTPAAPISVTIPDQTALTSLSGNAWLQPGIDIYNNFLWTRALKRTYTSGTDIPTSSSLRETSGTYAGEFKAGIWLWVMIRIRNENPIDWYYTTADINGPKRPKYWVDPATSDADMAANPHWVKRPSTVSPLLTSNPSISVFVKANSATLGINRTIKVSGLWFPD